VHTVSQASFLLHWQEEDDDNVDDGDDAVVVVVVIEDYRAFRPLETAI
jgi:hypothetical protein